MGYYRWLIALAIASISLISPVARLLPSLWGTLLLMAVSGGVLGWGAERFSRTFVGAVPALAMLAIGLGPTWVELLIKGVKAGENALAVHAALLFIAACPVAAGWAGAVVAWLARPSRSAAPRPDAPNDRAD